MIKVNDTEEVIVKLLRVGVFVSSSLITLGLIILYVSGSSGYVEVSNINFNEVFKGILELKPYYIIMLGLLVLIITPFLRVVVSITVFMAAKDYLYVKVTSVVLIILLISFFIGIYS